jgi:beta-lactamase regulating signal transducer with metallopeptidase domain
MAALSMVSAISMLGNAFSTLKNPDMSGWEKFTSFAMSFSMALPLLITGIKNLGNIQLFAAGAAGTDAAATLADAAAKTILGKAIKAVNKSLTESVVGMLALAGWIALAAAAVFVIVKALDALIKTEKEAKKETQEATEKYKEEK